MNLKAHQSALGRGQKILQFAEDIYGDVSKQNLYAEIFTDLIHYSEADGVDINLAWRTALRQYTVEQGPMF